MNKNGRKLLRALVVGVIALICGGIPIAGLLGLGAIASGDQRTEATLPQFGLMRNGANVTIVNLAPIRIAKNVGGSTQEGFWLGYGLKCHMKQNSVFMALGLDGQRVLVRSRQEDPGYLPPEGIRGIEPYCTEETLFWIGLQQFKLSAEAYRAFQRDKEAYETAEEHDKRVIRKLLDDQTARK